MASAATLLLAPIAAGGWWYLRRHPDPAVQAAEAERQGDLRLVLLERRNAVARQPESAEARLRLSQMLLKVRDGVAAEKGFRTAETMGASHWTVLLGLGEAELLQGHFQSVLGDVPDAAPDREVAARLLLLRGTAQLALDAKADADATLAKARRTAPDQVETMLLAARVALVARDPAAAEASVDQALRLDPDHAEALTLKLRLLTMRGARPEALAVADHLIAVAPWLTAPRLDRANLLLLANDDAKARNDVDFVLTHAARNPGALYLDAVLLARAGKDAEANSAFEKLGPIEEQFPRALYIHAIVASKLGTMETASTLAARYNARFPGDRDGILLLGRMRMLNMRPDLAIPALEAAAAGKDPAILELLGSAYAANGDAAGALRMRQLVATLAPSDAGALTRLGLSQLREGDTLGAVESLGRSAELAPQPAAVTNGLFEAALQTGEFDRAEAVLTRRRAAEGDSADVGSMTAMLLLARGDRDAAQQKLEEVVQAHPEAAAPRVNLARMLLQQQRTAQAEALLTDILAKEPANLAALSTNMQLWIGAKSFDQAIRAVDAAQKAAPNQIVFAAMRAELMTRAGDPAGALASLEARRVDGAVPPPLLPAFAQAQAASGATDAALATYRAMLRTAPGNIEARMGEVNALVQAKRLDEAKDALRAGIVQAPGQLGLMTGLVALETRTAGLEAGLKLADSLRADERHMPAAGFLRGDALMGAKQFLAAAQAYQAELDKAPSQALTIRAAKADVAAGQDDAAAKVLRGWAATHPDDPEASAGLAQLDVKAGRLDAAREELEARLKRRPNDALALNNLAWLYQSRNDSRALGLAQRAYAVAPAAQTADTLGWIMLQRGDTQGALPLLRQAVAQTPADPTLAFHLASALEKDGRTDEGRRLLEPVLGDKTSFDDRPAAEALLRSLQQGH